MYFIVSLIILVCLLLFIRFIPKNSDIELFKEINEYLEDVTYYDDYTFLGGILIALSLLWIIFLPLLVLLLIFYFFLSFLRIIINKRNK